MVKKERKGKEGGGRERGRGGKRGGCVVGLAGLFGLPSLDTIAFFFFFHFIDCYIKINLIRFENIENSDPRRTYTSSVQVTKKGVRNILRTIPFCLKID